MVFFSDDGGKKVSIFIRKILKKNWEMIKKKEKGEKDDFFS
jgi:hypothetical protein